MEVDSKEDEGMTPDVIDKLDASHKALSKGRRKRIKARASTVAKADVIRSYTSSSFSPHSSTHPGVLCLGLHPTKTNLSVTGGNDSHVVLFDHKAGKIVDTLKSHRKKVNDVSFIGSTDLIVSASADTTAIIWGRQDRGYAPRSVLSCHTAEVVSCAVHPSNEFLVTASTDKSWAFHDITTGKTRSRNEGKAGFTAMAFHPDGMLLGACTSDNMVSMLDLKNGETRAQLPGHNARLSALAFSENGTYLATGDDSGVVKLWDLRTVTCFKTLTNQDMSTVSSLTFDQSGTYLGVGGDDVRIFDTNEWNVVKEWKDHRAGVTSVRFADKLSYFASTSLDRTVKFWSPSA
jgi:pre-mRNA-processing factor 19